jgi:hypothetical protein
MFTPEQYREKAAQYTELARHGNTPNEVREFQTHERSLTMLADNKPQFKPTSAGDFLWALGGKRELELTGVGAAELEKQ